MYMQADLRALLEQHYLIRIWLWYRIRIRYAQTALGITWIITFPLMTSLVYAFAIGEILGAKLLVDVPYVPFILSGQVIYTIFSSVLLGTRGAFLSVMGLSNQIYFPREIVPILILGEALVDFFFAFLAMLIVNAYFGIVPFSTLHLAIFPLITLCTLTLALSLFLSWFALRIRDLQPLLTILLQLLFFLTPIFFNVETIPVRYRFVAYLNPLTPIVEAFRAAVLGLPAPDIQGLLASFIISAILLILGYGFFKKREKQFMDYQ